MTTGAPTHTGASPYATVTGTTRYRARFGHLAADHFRLRFGLWLSSIGLGSYLPPGMGQLVPGEGDAQPVEADGNKDPTGAQRPGGYEPAVAAALQLGCNLIDTAGNYRRGESEREIGRVLHALIRSGVVQRDEVVLCSKGGFVEDARNRALAEQLAEPDEIVQGAHCLSPRYLSAVVGRTLENLGLATVDVYYLHNPEFQLRSVSPAEFKRRIRRAFAQLEEEAEAGRIRLYGVATWDGLRASPQNREYLPLVLLEQLAREVGGEKHRFRFVQFPYNVIDRAAFSGRNQPLPSKQAPAAEPTFGPLLAAAMQLGLAAVTSATLGQGRVLARIPAQFARALGEWETRAQAAIQFGRSTPGVTTALVGMGAVAHVQENLAVARHDTLPPERFYRLFQRPAPPPRST